ncbi:gliding motility lipoprotein GldD [Desertivirga brevis]|uniref:gliding motility lipoprotein GldD n=1 Tax=Desertivirga brevis TaxID=2810310 RepID=UPI001A96AD35|nr:gliding motility lipoprotein GldD [Pedobacter sp. SYSU D00873]
MKKYAAYISLVLALLSCISCGQDYSPKPRGYFRISFPTKSYQTYNQSCPFSFDYPTYAQIEPDSSRDAKPCWMNVYFPQFKGRIHISYQAVTSNKVFDELIEDARKLAFKHTVKATGINEGRIYYPDRKVYGIYYTIEGNTASSAQFFLTDSTKNYVRGALYFNEAPKLDSIQPVLDFVKKDLDVFIKSFHWKG